MPRKRSGVDKGARHTLHERPISLKKLAEYVGLAPATVSLVINRSAVADSIPQETKDRIFAAARKFNYRPNFFARSLRTQRSFTIGVMVPEVSDGYAAMVMSGIEDHLLQEGYFYFVASHRHRPDLIDEYPRLFLGRSVDGLIAVDTPWHHDLAVPVVTVSGHNEVKGVTNIVLDHERAAELALKHLLQLGHRKIAFIKGQEFSSDTAARWNAIEEVARRLGLPVSSKLTVQLEGDSPSPQLGYKVTKKLLATHEPFTALFAFNDISAMGAIRALRESGKRVPEDVSVVGFDDIQSAAYQNPGLTTVRQPLRKMGKIAAETVLRRITRRAVEANLKEITVEPELVVRETTCAAGAREEAQE
ncbi:MAG TPA: LacI family DNA-binding transcriptional regulator [Terriglobales bacterium]|nr:LacI family DNA-binding transcriptional regulator [Terriglobales bacterium]